MISKSLPDDRFLWIDYYKKGANRLGGKLGVVTIKEDDYRLDKVKKLWAPVGATKKPVNTHTFVYDEEMEKNDQELKSGKTYVYDAYRHQTKYEYDKHCRLTSLVHYRGVNDYHTYSKELFVWLNDEPAEGCLFAKMLTDKDQRLHSARFFGYDERGNVIKTILCGSLTGESSIPVTVDGTLQLVGHCEAEVKDYTYSKMYNLIKSETDSNGVTVSFHYVPETDWLASKLTSWKGKSARGNFTGMMKMGWSR